MSETEALKARMDNLEQAQVNNRSDFNKLYDRLDHLTTALTKVTIELEKQPKYIQPCKWHGEQAKRIDDIITEIGLIKVRNIEYDRHLVQAESSQKGWQSVKFRVIGYFIQWAILAGLGIAVATKI